MIFFGDITQFNPLYTTVFKDEIYESDNSINNSQGINIKTKWKHKWKYIIIQYL